MFVKKKKVFILNTIKGKKNIFWGSWGMLSLFMMATWQYWQYSENPSNIIGNNYKPSELSQIFAKTADKPIVNSELPDKSTPRPFVRVTPSDKKTDEKTDISNKNSSQKNIAITNPREAAAAAGFDSNLNVGQTADSTKPTYNGYAPQLSDDQDTNTEPTYNGYTRPTSADNNPEAFGFKTNIKITSGDENNNKSNSIVLKNVLSGTEFQDPKKLKSSRLKSLSSTNQSNSEQDALTNNTNQSTTAQYSSNSNGTSTYANPWGQQTQTDNSNLNTTNSSGTVSTSDKNRSSVSLTQQSNRYVQNIYNFTYSGSGTQNSNSSGYNYTYSSPTTQTNTGVNNVSNSSLSNGVNGNPSSSSPYTSPYSSNNSALPQSSNLPESNQLRPSGGYTNPYSTSYGTNSVGLQSSSASNLTKSPSSVYTNPYSVNSYSNPSGNPSGTNPIVPQASNVPTLNQPSSSALTNPYSTNTTNTINTTSQPGNAFNRSNFK